MNEPELLISEVVGIWMLIVLKYFIIILERLNMYQLRKIAPVYCETKQKHMMLPCEANYTCADVYVTMISNHKKSLKEHNPNS